MWPGNKTSYYEKIKYQIPQFKLYIEPFAGSGAIYFKLLSERGKFNAIINDINVDLISVYEVIRDDFSYLVDNLPPHKDKILYSSFGKLNTSVISKNDLATRFLYRNRNSFYGLGGWMNADRYARNTVIERIKYFSPLMKNTEFSSTDAFDLVKFFSKDAFVFVDPPYIDSNNLSCYDIKKSDSQIKNLNIEYLKCLLRSEAQFMFITKHIPVLTDLVKEYPEVKYDIRKWKFRKPQQKPSNDYEIFIWRNTNEFYDLK